MSAFRRKRSRGLAALFAAVLGSVTLARAAEPKKDVVMMSPVEVSAESMDFAAWGKFSSAHCVLYTDASPRVAESVLREMEMLQAAAQRYFRRKATHRAPVVVVLPTNRSDWQKIASKGGVDWKAAASNPATRVRELILAEYEWETRGRAVVHAMIGGSQIRAMNLGGPLWFTSGTRAFFETAEFKPDSVTLGRQNPRLRRLASDGWLPWERFFRVDSKSPEYTTASGVQRYFAQCSVFVQYLLTQSEPGWLDRLLEWVSLLEAGREPTEAEFTRVFGQDWKTWQRTMENYVANGHYQIASIGFPPGAIDLAVRPEEKTVREMRELFVLSQVLNQKVPDSRVVLDSLLARGLKTESLREFLAEACLSQRRTEAALGQFRELMARNSANPGVYAMAADVLFRELVPQRQISARLGKEAADIRGWCRRALELEPRHALANNTLAWTEALAPEVTADSVTTIENIYRTLNGYVPTSDTAMALAIAHWRNGDRKFARAVAQKLVDSPFASVRVKTVAAALLKELGPEQ